MAFNPFTSFRKYQKFWMASVLLVSMISFVLCSGVGRQSEYGLGEDLLRMFRDRGEVYATFNGSKLYAEDVNKLRDQRNLANLFLQNCKKIALNRTNNILQSEVGQKLEPEARKWMEERLRDPLEALLRQKNHFQGGAKLKDVVDFKAWLAEADRLRIRLDTKSVESMVLFDTLGHLSLPQLRVFDMEAFLGAQRDALSHFRQFSTQAFYKALTDEYRVRLAQLALAKVQPNQVMVDNKEQAFVKARVEIEPRAYLSLEQLWQFQRNNVSPYTVSLLPIASEQFVKAVQEPTEVQLEALFNESKGVKYDPSSDKPGFEQPQRAKFAYVTADPDAPSYRTLAAAVASLRDYPIADLSPVAPQGLVLRLAAGKAVRDQGLNDTYQKRMLSGLYVAPSLGSENLPAHLAAYFAVQNAEAAVSLLAGLADPGMALTAFPKLIASDLVKRRDEIQTALREEATRRSPTYATLVGVAAANPWLYAASKQVIEEEVRLYLPLSIVRSKAEKVQERNEALRFALDTIVELRRKIDGLPQQNNKAQLDRALAPYLADKRVELKQTEKHYSRFDVKDAPELKPLRDAYVKELDRINVFEGRGPLFGQSSTTAALDEQGFWKLFFDSGERFSVAGSPYGPKPWPPDVAPAQVWLRKKAIFDQNMSGFGVNPEFSATFFAVLEHSDERQTRVPMLQFTEKPFLVWKVEDQKAFVPESLKDVREQVVRAWKLIRARDTHALPLAEKIARDVAAGNPALASTRIDQEAAILGTKAVIIPNVAPFSMRPGGDLVPFAIGKAMLEEARPDASEQVLSLIDLKKPIEIGVPAVDAINKSLYDTIVNREKEPKGKFVQILANKPRTVYYVAAAGNPESLGLQLEFFRESLRELPFMAFQAQRTGRLPRELTARAMEAEAKESYEAVLTQLRKTYRTKIEASEKSLSSFDSDHSGGGGGD